MLDCVAGGVFRGVINGFAAYIRSGQCEFFDVLENQEIYFGSKGHFDPSRCQKVYRAAGRALGMDPQLF